MKKSIFKKRPATPVLLQALYRSRLERRIADQLTKEGIPFSYEGRRIKYMIPAREATYTPDFFAGSRPIVIESKGRFRTTQERQKLLFVRAQYPEIDLRLVFQNAKLPIYKNSPTTYAAWADSRGITWADGGVIPEEWIKEMRAPIEEIKTT